MPKATPSPWCTPLAKSGRLALTIREVALFGVLGGLTFAAKVAMAGLPNIEPVSLMVMLFAVIFGAKAAPGYDRAKAIIHLINMIADKVNADPDMDGVLKVIFVQNYNCSYAEHIYGFNLWSINYLYIWAILAAVAWLFRKMTHPLGWALLSGAFGLLFGFLCAPVYLFVGGWGAMVSWWISGIPWDVAHCAGNFVIALVLFVPLRRLMSALYRQMGGTPRS